MAITREMDSNGGGYTFTCKKKDIPQLPTDVAVNSRVWAWDVNKVYVLDEDGVWSPTGTEKP